MTNKKHRNESEEPTDIPVESDADNAPEDEGKTEPANEGDIVHYEETPAGLAGLPDRKKGQDESQPPEEKADEPAPIPGHLHR